jgi:UDP:flavonoid glycosyltransferase YjiC (YdhE family)
MRVLFTSVDIPGHLNPTIGAALSAQEAGHEVLIATAEAERARIESLGLPLFPAGVTADDPQLMQIMTSGRLSQPGGASLLFETAAHKAYEGVEAAITSFRPELVFSDMCELSAPALAERAGVPVALFGYAGTTPPPAVVNFFGAGIEALRRRAGLANPAAQGLLDATWVYGGLPSFMPDGAASARRVHHVKPRSETRRNLDPAPAWARELRGKRSVYMTLGTAMAPTRPGFMETILEGLTLAELDVVVVTTGPRRDPAKLPALPTVRVDRYIPQAHVLPNVAAAVLHAGYGSVTAALEHGLPLVLIPFGADQPGNAECCVRLGTAIALDKDAMTQATVRDAISEVLGTPSYAERARAVASELAALPSLGQALEAMVAP